MSSKEEDFKFIGEDSESLLPKETFNDILGVEDKGVPKFVPPTQPKVSKTYEADKLSQEVSAQQTPEKEAKTAEERIAALEEMIMKLRAGIGEVKVVSAKNKQKLDFSKLTEADVYDLSVPIEAIDHEFADFSKIELKDPAYIGRWINVHPGRLGPMKAAGFTPITPEDLASPLGMDLDLDENGQYRWIDVIAMKAPKEKYLRELRTNYLRALAQTQQKKVHELAQQVTENAIMNGTAEDKAPMGQATEYQKRKAAGQMNIYSPNL